MMHRELAYIEWRLASRGGTHETAETTDIRQKATPEALRSRAVVAFDAALEIMEVCYGAERDVYQQLLRAKAA